MSAIHSKADVDRSALDVGSGPLPDQSHGAARDLLSQLQPLSSKRWHPASAAIRCSQVAKRGTCADGSQFARPKAFLIATPSFGGLSDTSLDRLISMLVNRLAE